MLDFIASDDHHAFLNHILPIMVSALKADDALILKIFHPGPGW
jgi:hypothetical protein